MPDNYFLLTSTTGLVPLAVAVTVAILILIYYWTVLTFDHWERLSIPCAAKPVPFFGNMLPFIRRRENYAETIDRIYRSLDGLPYGGYYEMREPVLMIRDPNLIEAITIKDFEHFNGRKFELFFNPQDRQLNPLSSLLFVLPGQRWKRLRSKLTALFTKNNLDAIATPSIVNAYRNICRPHLLPNNNYSSSVDVKKMTMNYVLEAISGCVFGQQNIASERFVHLIEKTVSVNYCVKLILSAFHRQSSLLRIFRIADFPKQFTNAFVDVIKRNIELRESDDRRKMNKDFLQTMIDIKTEFSKSQNDQSKATSEECG